ncbi:MAG: hypothetical protein KDJ22_02495 [Candidatus Competibacteraceae bacterium]|nr:hypothetical protein [Candidatus Competibacteraceae bacterium]MCP5127716.1 hypothetical protein [Gammaproteobacteria bacterium]HRX70866.1 hypothetical protein [Candidatus Competibacteraceae bacterium]
MHLLETRLSEGQVVQDRDGDDYHFWLTATVNDTSQLRWWLLSFGSIAITPTNGDSSG